MINATNQFNSLQNVEQPNLKAQLSVQLGSPLDSASLHKLFRQRFCQHHRRCNYRRSSEFFRLAPCDMLTSSDRRKALRAFKQRGIVVHVGALEHLHTAYQNTESGSFPQFLDKSFDLLSRPDGARDGILTKAIAQSIGNRLQRDTFRSDVAANIEVIDVFTAPKWKPNSNNSRTSTNTISSYNTPSKSVIDAPASAKSELFRLRYELILSKTLRNEKFKPPLSGISAVSKQNNHFEITGVEGLRSEQGEKLVLGMLTQLEEGIWFLEDINGSIKLDLSSADITAGLHTDGSFIIAQGVFTEEEGTDPVFRVSAMGTPPSETRELTIEHLGKDANLFGGHFDLSCTESLLELEKEATDSVFLFLSDVALDNPKVLAGIRHLFQGYLQDEVVPTVIVLMGNFLSHAFGQRVDDIQSLQEGFTRLGNMIKTDFAPLAESSTFVLVPSTSDAGPGNILPRPPLPKMLTRPLQEAMGSEKVFSATNPCRIRYMTQEIVIMRDNILQKMVRHCSIKPDFSETGLMCEHLVKSLVDQSYLSPLPITARPVLWAHHQSLWLFPTPHVVVTADKVDGFICKYGGCLGLNPGSFATDFSFQIYLPAERRAQQCSLDSEDVNVQGPAAPDSESVDNVPSPPESPEHATLDLKDDVAPENDLDQAFAEADDLKNTKSRILQETGDEIGSDEDETDRDEDGHIEKDDEPKDSDSGDDEESDDVEESDDDSLLVPAPGLKKIDVKALVQSALAEDTSTLGQVGEDDSDEDGEQEPDEIQIE